MLMLCLCTIAYAADPVTLDITALDYQTGKAVVSAEHQQPGSTGMEAIYGVRPSPDDDGVYPYVYNMAAVAGMRVRENGETYVCTRDIDPLLYPPSQVTAHFNKEE